MKLISLFSFTILMTYQCLAYPLFVQVSWGVQNLGNNTYELIFKATIDEGRVVYSQYLSSQDGPTPTSIIFESKNQELAGKASETTSAPHQLRSGVDPRFGVNLKRYINDLEIRQRITVKDKEKPIHGFFEFMTCDDYSCMPPQGVDFRFYPKYIKENTPTRFFDANKIVQNPQPVLWEIKFVPISKKIVDLVATATIATDWYLYPQTLPTEDGPLPTSIVFDTPTNIIVRSNSETTSNVAYEITGMDSLFEMDLPRYRNDFTITKRLKIKKIKQPIKGQLVYMCCNGDKCMPPQTVEFEYSLTKE